MSCKTSAALAFLIALTAQLLVLAPPEAKAQSFPPSQSAAPGKNENPLANKTDCTDDAMLVFDGSTSMGNPGYREEIPRIVEARKAMRRVLPQITSLRKLGLVIFGPGSENSCRNIDYRLAPALGNAAQIIGELDKLQPAGNTPLSEAVGRAATLLNYRSKPAVVVLVTDGDESCGGEPCGLAVELLKRANALTIHVIGFKGRYRYYKFPTRETGLRVYTQARCLAETTGGKFITAHTVEELEAALRTTLGCPFVTQSTEVSSAQ